MKNTQTVLIFLFSFICLYGQTIIDVEIDELYFDDNNIAFINKGEISSYSCGLIPIVVKDFEHKLILECEADDDWMWSDNPTQINFKDLLEFSKPSKLIDYIKNYKFTKSSNHLNLKHNSFIQYYNDHLFADLNYNNYNNKKPNWQFNKAKFWDYVFIRINRKYLIIALIYEDHPTPGGFIIPTKDKTIVVTGNSSYIQDGERIDSIILEKHIPLNNFYRLKKTESGEQIFDKLFKEQILIKEFDKVYFKEKYIQCYKNNKIELYDKSGKRINIEHLRVAFDSLGSIQCIINDEIKWLDYEWNIHDTFPKPIWGVCGTFCSTERKIEKVNNKFYESYISGYSGQKQNRDSILIVDDKYVKDITYLNDQHSNEFNEYSKLNSVFSFPYSYYVLARDNEKQLISIINKRNAKARNLKIKMHYRSKSEALKDSLNILISKLEDEIEFEVIFRGKFQSFGYNHPIRFESNQLYGYYPQNKLAKYKRLERFNNFFAEFEDEEGREGWLDIYGNEYYKNE